MARLQRRGNRLRMALVLGGGAVIVILAGALALAPLFDLRPAPSTAGAQTVVISMAGFTPNRFTVLAGRPITLTLENPDSQFHTDGGGWHQFAIDEIKLDVRVAPHSTKTLTLPALRAGMYQFYCDVCCGGRSNPSMQGLLEVRG